MRQRNGVLTRPDLRLSDDQVKMIDATSRQFLENPGLICHNAEAARLLEQAGAKVDNSGPHPRISIPESIIDRALKTAPSKIVLGAVNPDNRLILDAAEPRVRFGSGSETNIWLDVNFDGPDPSFERQRGTINRLAKAAHLCEHLENLDFFLRCVNIQDDAVTSANKDVNKFFVSFDNMTKHLQGGLTDLGALDLVQKMAEIIAGGADALADNPVLSFITCIIKSPFEVVDDTTETLLALARRALPTVISSCPMGGASGPFDEFGMVALVNAEVLAGVILTQLAREGSPVLYGAVPVRTRLDNLNDMYAAPEFAHYTIDCAQMARFYGLPCYSSAGIADAATPGIQATAEKLMTLLTAPRSGAQYVHYAFGLLERTSTFCPEQAIMDDAHIGIIKRIMQQPAVDAQRQQQVLQMVREVMQTDHKTFVYNLPLPTRDDVYVRYPLEHEHGALRAAHDRYNEILAMPRKTLPKEIRQDIIKHIPGLLPEALDSDMTREEK